MSEDPGKPEPSQSPDPQSPWAPPVPPPRPVTSASPRRWAAVAAAAATALVVAAVGGYALGRQNDQGAAGPEVRSNPDGNQAMPQGPGYGFGPGGRDGSGGPWSGRDGSGSAGAETEATAEQVRGLVRIVSAEAYQQGIGVGTGMVLSARGEVVTNHHVVAGASTIRATVVSTGKTYDARVVGTDTTDDIAVLKLAGAAGLATVGPAAQQARVGDAVTAVGDAGGSSASLTAAIGTVAALDQAITTQTSGAAEGEHLTGLIEVDADVVAGDSGGPLLNAAGAVVGMDTAASSGSANVTGYAIPVTKVLRIVHRIDTGQAGGKIHLGASAFLGVELAERTSRATVAGTVAGTPAARAGLRAGDTITAIDGDPTRTATALRHQIAAHAPGDGVTVTWTDPRGMHHTRSVTLTAGPVA